jgi:sugar lactone lactonase YvrE
MATRTSLALVKPAIALLVLLAGGVGAFALLRLEHMTELPDSYRLDLGDQLRIDPAVLRYQQNAEFPVVVEEPHALAVGPGDRIYVAGRTAIQVLQPDGSAGNQIKFQGNAPTCLAIAGPDHAHSGQLFVGAGNRIHLLSADGAAVGEWSGFGEKSHFTSLAVADETVFAADAGNRVVLQLDARGQIQNQIGNSHADKNAPGFIIPSPYFDLVANADGLVTVVNPGARRVETFAATGELETVWGKASADLAGFFGCCNPAHLARLPDGRFVTSEKGVPRVKVYSSEGEFLSVVAGPEQLGVPASSLGDARSESDHRVFEVACDSQGRVLVLDPIRNIIRVFVEKTAEEKSNA